MKKILIIAVAAALSYASFEAGRLSQRPHYEAACILSDICHHYLDSDESGEFEELYYDVLDNLDCYNASVTREEVDNDYPWPY